MSEEDKEDTRELDPIQEIYEEATGKKAIWQGSTTKQYKVFLSHLEIIKENDLA